MTFLTKIPTHLIAPTVDRYLGYYQLTYEEASLVFGLEEKTLRKTMERPMMTEWMADLILCKTNAVSLWQTDPELRELYYQPPMCEAGKHVITEENVYSRVRPTTGRMEHRCEDCRREYQREKRKDPVWRERKNAQVRESRRRKRERMAA